MPTLYESDLESLPRLRRGKVRDIYAIERDRLLIVASDRLSAFDVVLPTPILDKGRILTTMSNFWFNRTQHIVANHLTGCDVDTLLPKVEAGQVRDRAVIVRRIEPLPLEAIVRGYLAGSGWAEYQRSGTVCSISLPQGLRESEQLPHPLFTPSTKASVGEHDVNIDFQTMIDLLGGEEVLAEQVREVSLRLYQEAQTYALERGIIIADTKFEFGRLDGELFLIDEALTPDSSRFWPCDAYDPGHGQPSFDKQYVRDYLTGAGWDKRPPAPALPDSVVEQTTYRYREALRRLTEPLS